MNSRYELKQLISLAHILSSQDVIFRSMFFLASSERTKKVAKRFFDITIVYKLRLKFVYLVEQSVTFNDETF